MATDMPLSGLRIFWNENWKDDSGMSDTRGGSWEFDENGNVHYVPPEGEQPQTDDRQERVDGTYHRSYTYTYSSKGSGSQHHKGGNDKGWHWIFIVLAFMVAWPIGLILLFLELSGKWPGDQRVKKELHRAANAAKSAATQARNGYQNAQKSTQWEQVNREAAQTRAETNARRQKADAKTGKGTEKQEAQLHGFGNLKLLRILGGILSVGFGFAFVMQLIEEITYFIDVGYMMRNILPLLALFLAGIALLGMAGSRKRKMKKFRSYLSMIGSRDEISISSLAKAMGVSEKHTMQDLEEMLERDYFESGYIDAARNLLVLKEGGIQEEPVPEPQVQDVPEDKAESVADSTLKHIRQINDDIDNPELSRKIDRIEELTAKIFRLLEARPEKAGELKSFMNYYLPQTLKILENYAKLEEQDVEGENIRETKQKIEDMMDKIVDGYETQLDKLFADDALDISADLKVMETMLEKDGLTADNELKL